MQQPTLPRATSWWKMEFQEYWNTAALWGGIPGSLDLLVILWHLHPNNLLRP